MSSSLFSIRRTIVNYLIIFLFSLSGCSSLANKQPVDYANPNLGSYHARWFFYTPAAVPFGMAKLL
jgi:hypothetical protein